MFGIKFPTIPMKKAVIGDNPMLIPNGIPKRSSTPGSMDPKNVAASGVMKSGRDMNVLNALFLFE